MRTKAPRTDAKLSITGHGTKNEEKAIARKTNRVIADMAGVVHTTPEDDLKNQASQFGHVVVMCMLWHFDVPLFVRSTNPHSTF
jgi:hypothetical protein